MTDQTERELVVSMIRELQRHCSLETIAVELSVSARTVDNWVAGLYIPHGFTLLRLIQFHERKAQVTTPKAQETSLQTNTEKA